MFFNIFDIFGSKTTKQCLQTSKKIKKEKVIKISHQGSNILGDITNHQRKINFENSITKKIKETNNANGNKGLISHKYFLEDKYTSISKSQPITLNYVILFYLNISVWLTSKQISQDTTGNLYASLIKTLK